MVIPVLLLTLGTAAVVLSFRRHWPRWFLSSSQHHPSPVAFQHLQIYQGGMLNSGAIATAKEELANRLSQRQRIPHEISLRAGLDYAVQVRALAAIGTDEAGRILENEMIRQVSRNRLEQSWYWLDVAQGLRSLGRSQSLPLLLRSTERDFEYPLGHLFAAEIAAFPEFADYVQDPLSTLGKESLRSLRLTLEGIRRGYVPVSLYADANLGDLIHRLAETCPDIADASLTLLFLEALRHARRSYQTSPELRDDPLTRQAVRRQAGLFREAEPVIREYLHNIGDDLARLLPYRVPNEQREILHAIQQLHTETGCVVLRLLQDEQFTQRCEAIACLQWSTRQEATEYLVRQAQSLSQRNGRWQWFNRSHQAPSLELVAVLKALRGHPHVRAEKTLLELSSHSSYHYRIAAMKSLGWWEPIDRRSVLEILHLGRIDARAEVRMAAIAALARLGECASLQVLRDSLTNTSSQMVLQSIELIANEGLTWLWPELDLVTEYDDPVIAHHAWEAVEGLRESILGPMA